MCIYSCTSNKTWQCKSIGNLLDSLASRTQSWRRNIGTTVVVDDNSYNDIGNSCNRLTEQHRLRVIARIAHLGSDGEEKGRASVGEDNRRNGRHGISKVWDIVEFIV